MQRPRLCSFLFADHAQHRRQPHGAMTCQCRQRTQAVHCACTPRSLNVFNQWGQGPGSSPAQKTGKETSKAAGIKGSAKGTETAEASENVSDPLGHSPGFHEG